MSALRIEHLSVTYTGSPPVAALFDVNLDIAEGSLTAVLGPSGCGKTTLLRTIAGLERPGAGRITMHDTVFDDGREHLAPERRNIGLVPQDGALFPHLDVAGNIAFGLRRTPSARRAQRVEEMLALVGLEHLADRRPDQLSGGQQQRVALARALAPRPSLVLLDEPFSALDSGLRAEVRNEVAQLLRAATATALIVTHDQTEALEMADVVAVLRDGRLVQTGPPTELYHRPVDAWTGQFIGDALLLDGMGAGGAIDCALGRLSTVSPRGDGPAVVLLRPEQLRVSDAPGSVGATVRAVRFRGADSAVDVDVADAHLTVRWSSGPLPEVGSLLRLVVDGPCVAYDPADGNRGGVTRPVRSG